MKLTLWLSLATSTLMVACTSLEDLLKSSPVPQDRIFISTDKSENKSTQLTIIRDRSLAGGACYYAIYIDDKLASRIGSLEKATFNLEPGDRKIQIKRDKQGEGLCSLGDDETTAQVVLAPKEKRYYRLSQDMAGAPHLKFIDVPSDAVVR